MLSYKTIIIKTVMLVFQNHIKLGSQQQDANTNLDIDLCDGFVEHGFLEYPSENVQLAKDFHVTGDQRAGAGSDRGVD